MRPEHVLPWAGVIVALTFFALIAYTGTVLRANRKLAGTVAAVATLTGTLPAIPSAPYAIR